MTLRETLTALTPYEVHAQNSDTFESFEPGKPITSCEGENVGCVVTEIGKVGRGPNVAGLVFRAHRLVFVVRELYHPPKNETDGDLARSFYVAIGAAIGERSATCILKTRTYKEEDLETKEAQIVCGQRTITISLISSGISQFQGETLSVALWETLGEAPKQ
jgi:hypothetical protein